jgi:osmotically-inducible protein OsmY
MTRCLDEAKLQSYFDGELPIEQMESVTSHLASCANCAAAARELEEESALVMNALAVEFEASVPTETLRQRIESQLFRDRHIPKGDLNINCEHGMVILRGELDSPMEIAQLEDRVRRMAGVRGVQNLLHPHGTPAPNKQRSWAASEPVSHMR